MQKLHNHVNWKLRVRHETHNLNWKLINQPKTAIKKVQNIFWNIRNYKG